MRQPQLREFIDYQRDCGALSEKPAEANDHAPSGQDRWALDAKAFEKLIILLRLRNWTASTRADAQNIWDDQFSTPGDVCGPRLINWTGAWPAFKAFYDASCELFESDKGIGEFFSAHFLYHGEKRNPEAVRNGARHPTQEHMAAAVEIVAGLKRMADDDMRRPPAVSG